MPAVAAYADFQGLEMRNQPHSHLATYIYFKLVACCEDLGLGPLIHEAKLTELGPPRQMRAIASTLRSARLLDEDPEHEGYLRIGDFARYSGAVLLDALDTRRRSRAGRAGARSRWNGKDQLELGADAISMASACDPPRTPPESSSSRAQTAAAGRKESVGVSG
jgi:hypothetical protein